MTNLINKYFDYQIKFEKKYGENTIVLMQVGTFFEMYGVDNEYEKLGDLKKITTLLNILLSRRDKSILMNSRQNALMAGIPTWSLKRYLNILIENNYTIIMIEQVTAPPNPKREITQIISPGTYIDEVRQSDSNNIVSIYIDQTKCYKSGQKIWTVGCSSLDLSTGSNMIYETFSYENDIQTIMEEMFRFIETNNPSEILINGKNLDDEILNKVKQNINLVNRILHCDFKYPKSFFKISYQNLFLKEIFPESGILEPIEYLDLERKMIGLISYMIVLQFSYEHNKNIIKKINKPKIWNSEEHLTLYHDSVYQLNILPNNIIKCGNKFKSLFDVINFTKTTMGKRLLKYRLVNPITDIVKLNKRYSLINTFITNIDNDIIKNTINNLKNIIDIERLQRKLSLKSLQPCEFYQLHNSYLNINKIIKSIFKIYKQDLFKLTDSDINEFNVFQNEYLELFDVDEMGKYTINDIEKSFIKKNKYKDIDKINFDMIKSMIYLENETDRISNMINMNSKQVKLYNTERDGYFISITKKRYEMIKNKLKKDEYTITKHKTGSYKMINDKMIKKSETYVLCKNKIKILVKEKYLEILDMFDKKYSSIMKKISHFIAEIDLIQSSSNCSLNYGYTCPIINDKENSKSYFEAKELRHPIIERLSHSSEYISNNVSIGKNILLYGVNGSGKSSLSKAIGLNIILAQSGMFVPSLKFEYYPYTKIFTRINSDDNIFKGQSSFVVEMCELRSIIKYANKNSIVLGDEICKGTEEISALSIVCASIKKLIKKNVSFILATHFHKLYDLFNKTNDMDKLSFKHLTVKHDSDKIEYLRKLEDGLGDSIYGIEIAKFIVDDIDFINSANDIRNKLLNHNTNILEPKISNYNKDLYVNKCAVCDKNIKDEDLHTHHIKEQHEFNKYKLLGHIKKDNINNLVVLCQQHHHDVHNNKLEIYGYKDTTKGKILDYKFIHNKKKNKKKFNENDIEIINSFKNLKLSKQNIILQLKNNHNIKISSTTLNKIFNNLY